MFVMSGQLEIGNYIHKGLSECEVSSSWEDMTDTCKITIAKKLSWQGKPIVWSDTPILRKEDIIKLQLGYDERLHQVFKGYVTAIHTSTPIVLDCQDEMLILKKNNFSKAYRNVKLSELMADMLKPIGVKYEVVADYDLGFFRTKSNATIAQVLEALRKDYFMKFFFREDILYIGLPYVPKLQTRHIVKFNRHVIDDNLEYLRKDDIKIKMQCVIMYPNNNVEKFTLGADDGEIRTFHQYNVSVAEMKRLANIEMERLRYDGYRGSVTIFGEPHIKHGDIVKFINDDEPERTGEYLIKRVNIKFSQNGYRQILYPEGRVS
jgi:hypothetical protein